MSPISFHERTGSEPTGPERKAGPTAAASVDLTEEQRAVVDEVKRWFASGERLRSTMTVGGYAGTGKTVTANVLPEMLDISRLKVAYCAPTGKAASRLKDGQTIHRLIYHPTEKHCQDCPRRSDSLAACHRANDPERANCPDCSTKPSWKLKERLTGYRLIIVDEASMVSERIFEDLSSFGIPVVWIGDHGQLPPVKGTFNLMGDPRLRLETIHRQVADSPILKLAMMARRGGRVPFGVHGPGVIKRKANGKWPVDADLMLCGRNDTRVALNTLMRRLRGYPEDQPVVGDRVVCLKNDYDNAIYNGMTATVLAVAEAADDPDVWDLRLRVDGEDREVQLLAFREQFGQRKTELFGPRGVGLWDYGYCLTVHKAQGSESDRVVVVEQPIPYTQRARWLYTAITRAKRELEIIAR